MKVRILALAAACAALTLPSASLASPAVAGRISMAEPGDGKISIRRANGERQDAERGTWLYEGDQLSVTRTAWVCIDLFSEGEVKCYNAQTKIPRVQKTPPARKASLADKVGSLWNAIFAKPRYSLPSRTATRSAPDSQELKLEAHPLLTISPDYVQLVPKGALVLHPVWRGPSVVYATWQADNASPPVVISQSGWTLPGGVQGDGTLRLTAADNMQSLSWKVSATSSDVPRPKELAGIPEADLNVTDRADRAAWLLRDGPQEWHLFALTELFRLESQSYEAKVYLDFILSEDCGYPSMAATCPFLEGKDK